MTELLTIIDADGGELAVTEANNLRWEQPIEGAFSTKDKPKHERLMRSRPFRYVGSRMEQAGLKLKFGVMGHTRDDLKDRVEALRWRMDPDRGQFQLKRTLASAEVRQCYVSLSTFDADEKAIAHGGPLVPVTAVVEMSDLWFDPTGVTVNAQFNTPVTVPNGGFETGTLTDDDAASDNFSNWTETTDDGNGDKVESTATVHGGSHAVKITQGAGVVSPKTVSDNIVATAGEIMKLSLWARGDGTYDGRYGVYDVTNSAWIIALGGTGVTAATYAEVTNTFTVPAGCSALSIQLAGNAATNSVVYFDDVTLTRTTVKASCANSNVGTYIKVTIDGEVDTPRLTNDADDFLELEDAMVSGDELVVQFDPSQEDFGATMTPGSGEEEDWTGKRSTDSKWWMLAPGTTNVTLSCTGAGTAGVTIEFDKFYRVPA